MGWRVEKQVLEDGTIVCTAKYESEQDPRNGFIQLLGRVECPRCGEPGYLYAFYTSNGKKLFGTYFFVRHYTAIYNPERYRELRKLGLKSYVAQPMSMEPVNLGACYFGRNYPGTLPKAPSLPISSLEVSVL